MTKKTLQELRSQAMTRRAEEKTWAVFQDGKGGKGLLFNHGEKNPYMSLEGTTQVGMRMEVKYNGKCRGRNLQNLEKKGPAMGKRGRMWFWGTSGVDEGEGDKKAGAIGGIGRKGKGDYKWNRYYSRAATR